TGLQYTEVLLLYNRTYAVGSKPGVCLDNRHDSPPAGWNETFFFRKKTKKYHAAAGASGFHRVKRPVWTLTA
ncbi:MAG: hypothetical protein ACLFVO_27235, partial [Chloroflexaceae bacterium]